MANNCNFRIRSLELMRALSPFINLGTLSATEAHSIVSEYQKGDATKLKAFIASPKITVAQLTMIEPLSNFIL